MTLSTNFRRASRPAFLLGWTGMLLLLFAVEEGFSRVPPQRSTDLSGQPMVQLLAWLLDPRTQDAAYSEIERRKDLAAVPGLIELMRVPTFSKHAGMVRLVNTLEQLTGERFGHDWLGWSEWLVGQEEVPLPEQFLLWKASLFGLIDPALQKFLETPHPPKIPPQEILWGGVRKDGIPSLDNPPVLSAAQATYLNDTDLVFGAQVNGEARAYPLRILGWHEMLNDEIAGVPVSLAYCTLCRSGILFDTRVQDGALTFGTSGFLYQSNKLMYDRQTETLWTTIPGRPVVGPLSTRNVELAKLPLVVTSWGEWREQHPDTRVLSLETGFERDYSPGAAYRDYFGSSDLWFPLSRKDRRVSPKEEIFGLTVGATPKAYVLAALKREPVLNDSIGTTAVVVVTSSQGGARAYLRDRHEFQSGAEAGLLRDAGGGTWRVEESRLVHSSSGESLDRLPGHLAYWFGWYAFYPQTLLFDGSQ